MLSSITAYHWPIYLVPLASKWTPSAEGSRGKHQQNPEVIYPYMPALVLGGEPPSKSALKYPAETRASWLQV